MQRNNMGMDMGMGMDMECFMYCWPAPQGKLLVQMGKS